MRVLLYIKLITGFLKINKLLIQLKFFNKSLTKLKPNKNMTNKQN